MANQKYTLEFKEEAVRQVLDRGYSVKEVAENLGVINAQPVQVGEGDATWPGQTS